MYPSLNPGADIWGPSRFWGTLAFGYIGQTVGILTLFLLTLLYPQSLQRPTFPIEVTWLTPSQAPTKPPEPMAEAAIPLRPALQVAIGKDVPGLQLPAAAPPLTVSPKPNTSPMLIGETVGMPTLAAQPKLGTFADQQGIASSAPPASRVQTGGFGDSNGLPGVGAGTGHLIAAQVGSFDLMAGPGQGNGTGGATGLRSKVVSSGFSDTKVTNRSREPLPNPARVESGSFGDVVPVLTIRALPTPTAGPPVQPAVVTNKPIPAYTDEARRLRIEGEVVMEVMFPSSGKPRVVRVIERLGHGLDESATMAVSKIEFKPAQQAGAPVDSKAIVRVIFKLA